MANGQPAQASPCVAWCSSEVDTLWTGSLAATHHALPSAMAALLLCSVLAPAGKKNLQLQAEIIPLLW